MSNEPDPEIVPSFVPITAFDVDVKFIEPFKVIVPVAVLLKVPDTFTIPVVAPIVKLAELFVKSTKEVVPFEIFHDSVDATV